MAVSSKFNLGAGLEKLDKILTGSDIFPTKALHSRLEIAD